MTRHDCTDHAPGTLSCYVNCRCRCRPCSFEASEYNRSLYRGQRRNVPVGDVQPLLADLYEAGWTQQDVAAEVGTARQVISRIEHGRVDTVRRATFDAIAEVHRSLAFDIENVRVPVGPLLSMLRRQQRTIAGTYCDTDRRALHRGKSSGWLYAPIAERLASQLGHNLSTLWHDQEWEAA